MRQTMQWIAMARLEPEAGPENRVRLALPADAAAAATLSEIAYSLTRREDDAAGDATDHAAAILRAARRIATGEAPHPLAAMVKTQFDYHNHHIARINGMGLAALFAPFACPPERRMAAEAAFKTSLFEFMRHIDAVFRENEILPLPRAGADCRVAVVNGMYRTGSTKAFLATQAVARAAGLDYVVRSTGLSGVDRLIECGRWGACRGKWLLIKSHHWMPLREFADTAVFYTRRNIADAIASAWRRHKTDDELNNKWWEEFLEHRMLFHKYTDDYCAPRYPLIEVDYDEYYGKDRELIQLFARHMGVALDEAALDVATGLIEVNRIKTFADNLQRAGDPGTLIQKYHVSETLGVPGGNLSHLPPSLIAHLRAMGEWPG